MRLPLPRAAAMAARVRPIARCARLASRVLLAAALAYAPPLPAQSWRTLTASKQLRGADSLHVRVSYGAGTLTLGAAPTGLLYDVHMRYDADRFRPTQRWDAAARTLVVGADSATQRRFSIDPRGVHLSGDHGAERASALTLGLAPGVPLDLALELGAAEARVDLTGLTIAKLRTVAAAADSRLTFGTLNPTPLAELEITSTAAGVTVQQLGNARAALVRVTTTVGNADLDLSGAWTGETALNLHLVLGSATVRVPRDVGVQVRMSKVLGNFDTSGLTQRDGAWYTANWATARRKLTIDADVVLGGVTLTRGE